MASSGSKKPAAKAPHKPAAAAKAKPKKPAGPPVVNPLPLKGKRVVPSKTALPAPKGAAPAPPIEPAVPPLPEPAPNEKQLCWIELVKNGNIFIARSHTSAGPAKEYKNRVLEDMLTELIVELQEEIQE